MNLYALVMAGGGGTRFWPLSRQRMPKQLLNLSGNDIMINETLKRCQGLIMPEDSFVVTNREQAAAMHDLLLPELPRTHILAEPLGKNTAPCVLYSALYIMETRGDGVICIFPADHHIADTDAYLRILQQGVRAADEHNTVVVIGVPPTHPATEYGYIKLLPETLSGTSLRKVDKFVEKPKREKAQAYLHDGSYFWNAGVFIAKASVLVQLFERFLPKMHHVFSRLSGSWGKPDADARLNAVYEAIDGISFDYGIMERMDGTLAVTGDYGWSDVGSWDALVAVFPADENGNIVHAGHVGIDTAGCVIYSDSSPGKHKLIATVGLKDVVIADTDDALLICPKDRAQDVRKVVDGLVGGVWEGLL